MKALDYAAGSPVMSLLTAVFTPFRPDGGLDLETVGEQADAVAAWGCPAVYVGGTAGEGASLTVAERMALLERWCAVAEGRMDVIAHVGHTSLAEAQALAAHAEASGARAVSAVPPYFHRPRDAAALTDFLAPLAAAAPRLPFIYYHIPSVTGVQVPASELLTEAARRIPTFAGIKYADNDLADFQRCLERAGDTHEMYFGSARLLLAAAGVGARAAIGSAYNFAAPVYLRLVRHLERGETDRARACQLLAQAAIDAASRHAGELPGFKAATRLAGVDCGPCREPLGTLDDAQLAALSADFDRIGFPDGPSA